MQQTTETDSPAVSTAGIFAMLLLVDSLHFVFARALLPHISPWISAMYVLAIGTVQVGVYGVLRGQLRLRVMREHFRFFAVVGVLVAVSTAINYAAVSYIDVGTASMLGKLTTLYSLLLGYLWLHEKLTRQQIAGAILALIGVIVITFQPGDYLRLGSLMIVISTFLYALHAAVVKRYGGEIDFLNFFFYRLLYTAGFLLLIALGRSALAWPSAYAWALLALVATVDVIISRSLYYLALRRLPISLFAIILTLSPAVTVLWAWLLFDTLPTPAQLLGGILVLLGVLLATLRRYGR